MGSILECRLGARLTTAVEIVEEGAFGAGLTGLSVWNPPDGKHPYAAYGWILQHAGFPQAALDLARRMQALIETDRTLGIVCKDAGRYVAAMWSFYLHVGDGLTLAALKGVCVRSGMLSPGRARLQIQLLEHLGYLERLDMPGPRRAVRLAPTSSFRAAWMAQLREALLACAPVEPEVTLLAARLHETEVLERFLRAHAQGLLGAMEGDQAPMPILRVFLHAHGGSQILWFLLSESEGEVFPPERTRPVSLSAMAERFSVSRIHVRRLFARAQAEGLTQIDPDGRVSFSDAARDQLRLLYAGQLVQLLAAAAGTARAMGL